MSMINQPIDLNTDLTTPIINQPINQPTDLTTDLTTDITTDIIKPIIWRPQNGRMRLLDLIYNNTGLPYDLVLMIVFALDITEYYGMFQDYHGNLIQKDIYNRWMSFSNEWSKDIGRHNDTSVITKVNGKLHDLVEPAIYIGSYGMEGIKYYWSEWYACGVLHRIGGPALLMKDDIMMKGEDAEMWFLNGVCYRLDIKNINDKIKKLVNPFTIHV